MRSEWGILSEKMKLMPIRPEPTVWGDRLPFGTICGEFSSPNGGWVHDVAFSPSGDVLAYVSEYQHPTVPYEPQLRTHFRS
jgi:actin related protein 2/3 complex subunit 1A/1B